MSSGGGPGLQSREGGNRIVPGGFDSHPFRHEMGGFNERYPKDVCIFDVIVVIDLFSPRSSYD